MKKKTTTRDLYWFSWFCYVFVMIVAIVIGVYIITGYAELIDNAYDIVGIACCICIVTACGVASIGSIA